VADEDKKSGTDQSGESTTPAPSGSAKIITGEQLVAGDRSEFPPVSPEGAQPALFDSPADQPAPAKPTGRPPGSKDTKPRKPRAVQLRNSKGHIIGNVVAPPGTPIVPPRTSTPPDFSDVQGNGTETGQPTDQPADFDSQATAEVAFDTTAGVLTMVFGDEWQPRNKEERLVVVDSLAHYFKSKNIKDIPPGVAVLLVVTTYAALRFRAPSTSGKVKLWFQWVKSKWQSFRARRKGVVGTIKTESEKTNDSGKPKTDR
jgi:hypothetical protein